MKREHWKSKIGFIWSAVGSAVGLGSIWRFPYVVGQNGGAAFVLLFCFFLFFISLPVLITELLIGRKTQKNPCGAYRSLSGSKNWGRIGLMTIITGLLVSSFYSVICGWTLGYLVEAFSGSLINMKSASISALYFQNLVSSPLWSIVCHFGFMFTALLILYIGVQKGIETANRVFMPMLFALLLFLAFKGLSMTGSMQGLSFLLSPDWSQITSSVVLMALGQAFFGLSIGQGTMVTYGSYLSEKENIPSTALPIASSVVFVSLLAGIAIFTVVFSVGAEPNSGTSLLFETLPMVFSKITGGYYVSILFFLLIFLAGLTSQISAMEPMIAYLMDEWKFSRHKASFFSGGASFLLGIPSALSFSTLKNATLYGRNFFTCISYLSINVLIPLGALAATLLVSLRWGTLSALSHLRQGSGAFYTRYPWISSYLYFSIKYLSPIVIGVILCNLLGFI